MDLALAGQVVLVTGAGKGIGRSIGHGFAAEGAHVAFHYHASAEGAEAAAKEARELGVRAMAVPADISDPAAAAALVRSVESELGPLDVLVNNAAVGARQRFLESTPADWRPQIDVTVTGMLAVSHAAHAGGTDPERLAKLTAAYPLRRLGSTSDVPPVVLLLASPLTSWVTGQVLSVNGGYAMV